MPASGIVSSHRFLVVASMGIRARIEDSLLLWDHGRLEGAFLNVLVAVAATSRLRFPDRNAVRDGEAFMQFLEAAHPIRLSVEYRGQCIPVEEILYKWLRCQLVHEGGLPADIQFMPDSEPGTLSVRAGGAPEFILKLSRGWFHHLVDAVSSAQENAAKFAAFDGQRS